MFTKTAWRKRFPLILYGFVLLLFPLTLLGTYLAQQRVPMPELQVLTTNPAVIVSVNPGSPAEAAGIQPGDVILQMNGRPFSPEHVSYQVWNMRIGQLLSLELQRGNQRFQVSIPMVAVAKVAFKQFILFAVVAFVFWIVSALFVLYHFHRWEIFLLFLLGQAMSLTLLFPSVDIVPWFNATSWVSGICGLAGMLSALLLFQFNITFPMIVGTVRQRRLFLAGIYTIGLALTAGWIIHNYTLYLPHVLGRLTALYLGLMVIAATAVQIYLYLRRVNPDGRRRLRIIMLGNIVSFGVPALLYLVPSFALGYPLIPGWAMALCFMMGPIAYGTATIRNHLFDLDRILNRSVVYIILSLVLIIFCVVPIYLIYWLVGDRLAYLMIVTALLLLVATFFDRTRITVQQLVDRFFYGGWYDYPRVVEKISEALARSLKWGELVDLLTYQVPSMMQLRGAQLQIEEQSTQALDTICQPQLSFPLIFEEETCGLWTVGPRKDGEDFSVDDRRILRTLARQAAIAANNTLLVRKMQEQMEEIQAKRELLAQIDRQLLSTREEERARLARDLHDGPMQALIGLNMQLGLFLPAGIPNELQNIREGIKTVVYDLRAMCAELRPPMLDTLGLSASLRVLAQDWSAHSGIPVHFEQNPEIDFPQLPEKVAVNLYRVAQEALSNIYRHAEAHQVNLSLKWDPASSFLDMIIQDDGKGFSYDSTQNLLKTGHMGLINMQERLALFGGNWQLKSSPECGTMIRASWKLQAGSITE